MPTTPILSLRYPLSTDPADVPSDMQKLASDVETQVVARPAVKAARVTSSTVQSILNATTTQLSFDTADYNYGTLWNSGAGKMIAAVTGVYQVNGRCEIMVPSPPTGMRAFLQLYLNGAEVRRSADLMGGSALNYGIALSAQIKLTASDQVDLRVLQLFSATCNTDNSVWATSFEMSLIGTP